MAIKYCWTVDFFSSTDFKKTGGFRTIDLGSVTYTEIRQVLKFVYSGECEITTENVINLTKAAKALKVIPMENACWVLVFKTQKYNYKQEQISVVGPSEN